MILDRKDFSLLVKVININHHNAAGSYAEVRVSDSMEFMNKGLVGEPNGNCMHEKGLDKGHIGDKYGFLLLTPVDTSRP